MSTPTVLFRVPETNLGTTTSWLPMPTIHTSNGPCATQLLAFLVNTQLLAAWDPGLGLFADSGFANCLPNVVTTWWEQDKLGPNPNTVMSISFPPSVAIPDATTDGACGHKAFTTALTSIKGDGSTFLACCPSGYTFGQVRDAGDPKQCTSSISSGQVVRYATVASGAWTQTSATVTAPTTAIGIQINGWVFDERAAAAGQAVPGGSCSEANLGGGDGGNGTSSGGGSGDISPTTAKALLGVGVATLVLGLLVALAGFWMFRRARRERAAAPPSQYGPAPGQVQQGYDPSKDGSPSAWSGAYGAYAPPPQQQQQSHVYYSELEQSTQRQELAAPSPHLVPAGPGS